MSVENNRRELKKLRKQYGRQQAYVRDIAQLKAKKPNDFNSPHSLQMLT